MTSSISAYTSAPTTALLGVWVLLASPLPLMMIMMSGVRACEFPSSMVMGRQDPPWHSHVMNDGSRGVKYFIRRSVMELHYSSPTNNRRHTRWKCAMSVEDKLLLKRQDHHANNYFRCVKFHFRSPSVVQVAWSDESKQFDISDCLDDRLYLDPWPLVNYETLDSDYSQCPFSGGYDLKVTDSVLGENGCNLMHRPMRMEVECVGGDGVVFDFTSTNCLPDIHMHSKQQTLCIASWKDKGFHFSVLRKHQDSRLWCLAVPVQRSVNTRGFLYSDLFCSGDISRETGKQDRQQQRKWNTPQSLKYFILDLYQRNFPSLCEDEYSECSSIECNEYFKQECKKSCDACNGTSHVKSCMFPKRLKGSWFLKTPNDYRHVQIGEMAMSIQGVGRFQCAAFPDSPARKSRIYSTVSVYDNGCRPRYTCLKLRRLSPSAVQYSLSQSYVWPAVKENFGSTICHEDRFFADQAPVEDLYRSNHGAGKPIISDAPDPATVPCNITSVHTLSATLPEGYVCSGSMFTHCEDPTKLRVEFGSCSGLIATSTDYRCLANYEGRYWERILLVQNLRDSADAICFVYNQFKPNEAYAMVAGECDQEAFDFARAGIRKPLLSLRFREESEPCGSVPVTTTLLPRPVSGEDARPLASGHSSLHGNRTHADQSQASYQSVSGAATLTPSDKSRRWKAGTVGEAISRSKANYGTRDEGGDSPHDDVVSWTANRGLVFILTCICRLILCVVSFR